MRFDHLIQILLPQDKKFFTFFEQSAKNLIDASELLRKIPSGSPVEREVILKQIQDLEHKGDEITHTIFAELSATFITPFDREDIHDLASALDDVMDFIHGCSNRFVLYKVNDCPKPMADLMEILHAMIAELDRGVTFLRDLRKGNELHQVLEIVNKYENDADYVFESAIADLFESEKDAIRIIKLKEIYVALETATDKCEDAANMLESILIKHA
jgi:predicted phosphate transport protein (TIGR00153 family)